MQKCVVLISNALEDLNDAFDKNAGWSHTCRPSRVEQGWRVYVMPNMQELQKHGASAFGLQFTATGVAYYDKTAIWTSDERSAT